jgi:hypothetical protein
MKLHTVGKGRSNELLIPAQSANSCASTCMSSADVPKRTVDPREGIIKKSRTMAVRSEELFASEHMMHRRTYLYVLQDA